MPNIYGDKERKGSQGRIPDSKSDRHRIYPRVNVTLDPDTFDRLENYCDQEERARSWVIQKAVDAWLSNKGY